MPMVGKVHADNQLPVVAMQRRRLCICGIR
jgi:hypothetical protein